MHEDDLQPPPSPEPDESSGPAPATLPLTVSRPEMLVGGSDATFRDLLHDFFAFAMRMDKARALFGEFIGLSATQYMALIALSRMNDKGGIGTNGLARHLHLTGAFMTNEVNKLVKVGYVYKRPHPTDGRRLVLELTQQGLDALDRLAEFQRPVNDALFASLKVNEFAALADILRRLARDSDNALTFADYILGNRMRK